LPNAGDIRSLRADDIIEAKRPKQTTCASTPAKPLLPPISGWMHWKSPPDGYSYAPVKTRPHMDDAKALLGLILRIAPLKSSDILCDTRLITELGYTSLHMMELMTAVEDHFRLGFVDNDFDLSNFETATAILALVRKARGRDT
jgi:acyl carrier protein